MKNSSRGFRIYFIVIALMIVGMYAFSIFSTKDSDYKYNDFITDLKAGNVSEVTIRQNNEVPSGSIVVVLSKDKSRKVVYVTDVNKVISDIDEIDTLVFDEIDTGISGIAAQIVGEKLSKIGKKKQVMCITHLPQIAANGHTHYRIEKNTSNNRTYTNIKELTFDERIDEIARLIAGNNITEKTIEHAHEIIELAQCD